MRGKKEIIKLDAIVVDVIKKRVLVSELENGHRLVALGGAGAGLRRGDRVRLAVCPGDMATGRIIGG